MILNKEKEIEYKSNSVFEGKDATISEEDLHKLWSMLQDPYKNSIGAIVREITSNCFDSHSEAGINDAVHVKIAKDETGWYWSAEDFGVGLSPQRMNDIYISYLKSTKENSNSQIGCFGLGSKSPLSYTDLFYIRTRYEGTEYSYILRKGEKTPRLEKLFEEPTTERNGTLIKIYIKNTKRYSYSSLEPEIYRFKEECQKQLCYFENVYFEGCDINNEYKIIEGKHWKVNNLYRPFSGMHISLGSVAYPIDWDNLGIEKKIDFEVALKFNIGELDIIQTREDVKYTPRTKEAILNKIELVKEEFKARWESKDLELEDIQKYTELRNNKQYYLEIGGISFDLEDLFNDEEIKKFPYYSFKPLKDFTSYIPNDYFFEYKTTRRLKTDGGIFKVGEYQQKVTELLLGRNIVGYRIQGDTSRIKNKYIRSLFPHSSIYFIERKENLKLKEYKVALKLKWENRANWRKDIKLFQKVASSEIVKITNSYKSLEVPEEFNKKIKEIKERRKISKEKILCFSTYNLASYQRLELDPSTIGNTCLLIGDKEQKEILSNLGYILGLSFLKDYKSSSAKERINTTLYKKKLLVSYTAKSNLKYLNNLKNLWTPEKVMSEECKSFIRVCTAYKISKEFDEILELDPKNFEDIYTPLSKSIKEIKDYVYKWHEQNHYAINVFIKEDCIPVANEKDLYDKEILDKAKKIKEYFEGLELIFLLRSKYNSKTEEDEFPTLEVAKYIYNYNKIIKNRKRFKRLNPYYYCTFNQEEMKWLEPNREEHKFQIYKTQEII